MEKTFYKKKDDEKVVDLQIGQRMIEIDTDQSIKER